MYILILISMSVNGIKNGDSFSMEFPSSIRLLVNLDKKDDAFTLLGCDMIGDTEVDISNDYLGI